MHGVDLHTHSNISDGTLSPEQLVHAAIEKGIHTLALTDHDTMDGLVLAQKAAENNALKIISGVEISSQWSRPSTKKSYGVHVVALNMQNPAPLNKLLEQQKIIRAERAKQMILTEFPYTSYAEFVKNPKNNSFAKSSEEVEKAYAQAFDLYATEKYDESKALVESALEKYPKDALVPKFSLLNAFNSGKIAGKEIMILQLEQIALNYARTVEGQKAIEMLKYLKSDLVLETTDQEGNKLNNTPQNLQNPTQQNQIPDPPQSGKFNSSSPQSPTESRMNSGIGAPSDSERPQAAAASGEVQELKIK